ncbi:MAG: hypothetical protein HQ589_08920, partial [Syntrophaceae bacterium]|nr:hypothetical protein [Syntrophaceae bacterium]
MKQPTPRFFGVIQKGKLDIVDHEKEAIKRWCRTFKDGTKIDITIRKHSSKRTNLQNRYYWGVVLPILADYFGHDNTEDLHNDLKLKFNPIKSKIQEGIKIGGTTTKMSTIDFMASEDSYVERICR